MKDLVSTRNSLRVMVLNAQDLFLFADKYVPEQGPIQDLSEIKWQLMSSSLFMNKSKKKCFELALAIKREDVDIVMITEVGGVESLDNFSNFFLDGAFKAYSLPSHSDRGIDLGYLVKRELPFDTELKSYFDYKLPAPSHFFSRDVLQLDLLLNHERQVSFLLTHIKSKLDLRKTDFEGRKRRKHEIEALIDIYLSLQKDNIPVLIGGDFNGIALEDQTEEEFKPIYEKTHLRDVAQLSGIPVEDRLTYQYVTRGGVAISQQLDYLFIDKKWEELLVKEKTSFLRYFDSEGRLIPLAKRHDQKSLQPSDHFPLLAEIKLKL